MKSFRHAIRGLFVLVKEEHNARIHLAAAMLVIILSVFLKISCMEWIAVILLIALVFATELINSSLERLCDQLTQERQYWVKQVKDLAAGSVLIAAIAAAIIGGIIFIPKLWQLFHTMT